MIYLYNLFKNAGTLLCAVNRGGIILGDAKEAEDALDGTGVDEGPLSAEEESVLLPFNVKAFLFFLEGALLIDAIVEKPESDELAAEKILVEGDPDDEVDEDDE